MSSTDPHALLSLCLRLLCAGVVLRSIQLLRNWRELPDTHLLGWNPESRGRKGLAWKGRAALGYPGCLILLILQATSSGLGLFVEIDSRAAVWLMGTLFLLQAWYNYRFAIVYQAADTMFLIGFGAVFCGALDPTDMGLQYAALFFLGVQSLLAYALSGRSKVTSSAWRDGSQLIEILRRSVCRMEPCGRWLSVHPTVAKVASCGVIGLELLFPLSVLVPPPLFAAVLASGVLFHAAIALVMGLPGFFWAFVATYPALFFLHQHIYALL